MLCLDIDNFQEVYAHDNMAIERAEKALALRGALPARVDFPTRSFCLNVTNPDLGVEEVISILATYGFRARLREDL